MNVRIGMTYTPKELEVELGDDQDGDAVIKQITDAIAGETPMVWLTDRKGRRVGVSTAKLSWVEVGPESDAARRVGFSAP